jgi:hypothetical protein
MRFHPATLASLALIAVVPAAPAEAPTRTEAPTPAAVESPKLPTPELRLRAATPRVRELLTTWDARERRLTELRSELAATGDRARSVALEDEIERFKFETDLEMLRIQAQYARREGQVEMAEKLESAVARLAAQRSSAQPNPSPRPAQVELVVPATAEQP